MASVEWIRSSALAPVSARTDTCYMHGKHPTHCGIALARIRQSYLGSDFFLPILGLLPWWSRDKGSPKQEPERRGPSACYQPERCFWTLGSTEGCISKTGQQGNWVACMDVFNLRWCILPWRDTGKESRGLSTLEVGDEEHINYDPTQPLPV